MIRGVILKVSFTHATTCFAYISPKYNTNNEQSQGIQVIHNDKHAVLWAVFSSTVPEGQIAINPLHSKLIGLEEGANVYVVPYRYLKVLDELVIETDSPDDQDILEHNVDNLQLKILDQLRLVLVKQKAVIWVSPSLPVVFTPKQTGLLVKNSRIIVKIDAFNSYHGSQPNPCNVPAENINTFKNIGLLHDGLLKPHLDIPKRLVLRALPIDGDGKRNLIHPYTVFIHEDLIPDKYKKLTVILATMTNIPTLIKEPTLVDKNDKSITDDSMPTGNHINDICVEIVPIDSVIYRSLCREVYHKDIPTVLIPKPLNAIINIENGLKIIFTIIGDRVDQPEHIEIVTYTNKTNSDSNIIEKFKNCVIENTHFGKKFLINNGLVKQNLEICNGYIQFILKPHSLKFTMLNSESFRHCTITSKCLCDSVLVLPLPLLPQLTYDCNNYCRTIKCMETLVDKIVSGLNFEIHREASFKGISEIKSNILVTGSNGAGKTALCYIVQKELTVWSYILHCRTIKGRKDITEIICKAIIMCQEHSPSVLICDDIDSLVVPDTEGSSPPDIAHHQRIAIVMKQLLQTCSDVCVLMTALSLKALHPALRLQGGKPLFTAHFAIPDLLQDDRLHLFNHLLNARIELEFDVRNEDIVKLTMDTGGNNVRDITEYFNKKIYKAVKKKLSTPGASKLRLVEDIMEDEDKASVFDIWDSVGGLDDVKRELTECIFWPIKYPALFPSQSCGVLLYGPPGTGKSYIGSCLARLTNMHMITVKGPELLSKYIGQSEKAVRDVFDEADLKRPCILFFDEFDSLAPKRGHDSTGVTDRVVNQLLARLDGAEGGARGAVLAASARPDLLDPALLRAGRLQRHVLCALPAPRGRYEVLRTLKKSVSVADEVDLQELAERTEGFSPADLKSLLVTAQLTRLEKQLLTNESNSMENVTVFNEDVESALEETKPSLSPEQRLFYDVIYKQFRGESLTPEERMVARRIQRQRVTLA